MVLTRQNYREIFDHLLENIALYEADDPELLALAAQNITRFDQFILIPVDDISAWTYEITNDAGNVVTKNLLLCQVSSLKHLLNWSRLMIAENNHQTPELTEWQTYNNGHFIAYAANPRTPPVTPLATAAVNTPQGSFAFKKGNKRDISLYPELKDLVHFSAWQLTFVALVKKDDLANVIDPMYKPAGSEATDVFALQQQFLFAVFTRTLKDSTAKDILRTYQTTGDAQKIYAKLCSAATKSAKAKLAKDDLSEFLTTAKLDHTWKGSHHGFILHWKSKLRAYEELADSSELHSNKQKRNLLSRAVSGIPYLREIENTHDLIDATSSSVGALHSVDFDTYLELITRAAHRDDHTRATHRNPKHRISQHVMTHDYVGHGEEMFKSAWDSHFSSSNNVHEIVFDDNFEDTLQLLQHQANITSKKEDTRKKEDRPHIPSELWCQLSEDVRLWYLGYNKAEIVKLLEKKKGYQ